MDRVELARQAVANAFDAGDLGERARIDPAAVEAAATRVAELYNEAASDGERRAIAAYAESLALLQDSLEPGDSADEAPQDA